MTPEIYDKRSSFHMEEIDVYERWSEISKTRRLQWT